jgi:hypothetical protein
MQKENNKIVLVLFLSILIRLLCAQDSDGIIEKEKKCEMKTNCNLPQCNCASTDWPINFLRLYRRDQIPQVIEINQNFLLYSLLFNYFILMLSS